MYIRNGPYKLNTTLIYIYGWGNVYKKWTIQAKHYINIYMDGEMYIRNGPYKLNTTLIYIWMGKRI